jgi:peptidyl-prolyl cis-trans isomerase SurA
MKNMNKIADLKAVMTVPVWQKIGWPSVAALGLCVWLAPAAFCAPAPAQSQDSPQAQSQAQPSGQSSGQSSGQTSGMSSSAPQTSAASASAPDTAAPAAAATPAGGPAPEDPADADTNGTVIEEIVARVNDDIITRSDLDRAREELAEDARQACPGCSAADIQDQVAKKEPDLLRNLIDQRLLVQRAKDDDINVDADVVKKLDDIRQQNHIASMEDLETKVDDSGMDFEDYKNGIRDQLLTQEVIRKEVSSRVIIAQADIQKYYTDHPDEFQRPEQVVLREIFVSTDNKTPDEIAALQKKAQGLLDRVRAGDDFGQLATHFSDGSTAKDGGELGTFERGQLAPDIEDQVFKMNRNQTTDVIQTKTGFLILQVEQRYEAGLQPLDKVSDEIENKLFEVKMQPQLRDYLRQLRMDSYVQVKPGYVDSAAVVSTQIQEVSATPDATKKVKTQHKFLFFGHKKFPTQGT